MSSWPKLIEELCRAARHEDALERLLSCLVRAQQALPQSAARERNKALLNVSGTMGSVPPVPQTLLVRLYGWIVQSGGDPSSGGAIPMALLAHVLPFADRFHDLCLLKARHEGLPVGPFWDWLPEAESVPIDEHETVFGGRTDELTLEDLALRYWSTILLEEPAAAWAHFRVTDLTQTALVCLSRSLVMRRAAAAFKLLSRSQAHDRRAHGRRSLLTKWLLLRDDEPLLILDPWNRRGTRASQSGMFDNAQLYAILARLNENPRPGESLTLSGSPLRAVACRLWHWTVLGFMDQFSLPEIERMDSLEDHLIRRDGLPADILRFEDLRIVVLERAAPMSLPREPLPNAASQPELWIDEILTSEQVDDWVRKLANAARLGPNRAGPIS